MSTLFDWMISCRVMFCSDLPHFSPLTTFNDLGISDCMLEKIKRDLWEGRGERKVYVCVRVDL